jgi:uncharacterized protein (TIGR03067 family)
MKHALMAFLLAGGIAIAADPQEESAKALKELEGTYTLVAAEKQGQKAPDQVTKDVQKVTIKGNRLTITLKADEKGAKLFADPSKSPKEIDMTPDDGPRKGEKALGIYKVEGDELWLCFDEEAKNRPKEFKTDKDSKCFILRLKRAKE